MLVEKSIAELAALWRGKTSAVEIAKEYLRV